LPVRSAAWRYKAAAPVVSVGAHCAFTLPGERLPIQVVAAVEVVQKGQAPDWSVRLGHRHHAAEPDRRGGSEPFQPEIQHRDLWPVGLFR
jgi:hypothetical protein